MPLQKLQFRPGIVRDVTAYTNEGGWYDCDYVRFRNGVPQSVGGWQKYSQSSYLGTCRSLLNWVTLSGSTYLSVGTNLKFYIEDGGTFNDITPLRETAVLTNPFTTNTTVTLTVTDVAHGCTAGDFVTFSGASAVGGVLAATLNAEHVVATIVSDDVYTITLLTAATSSTTGGGTVTAKYQINIGLDTQVGGNGWGAGPWSGGTWGTPRVLTAGNTLRLWGVDNFGEDLIFNVRNGGVYYWDKTTGFTVRALTLSEYLTGIGTPDATTPTIATQMMVSDRDRHVIAFGSNYGSTTVQDPLSIRFSTQEMQADSYTGFVWTPTATNTAGELLLGSGTKIIRALETKREILVWTDVSLYSMQFIGAPYSFGIQQIASGITSMGFNCFASVDDNIVWMGLGKFYTYSGQTSELPCPIRDYIFTNLNIGESDKVFASVNSEFNEITWFYPTADSTENNAYVTYNYAEKAWTFGTLARTAWIDRGVNPYPVAAGTDNFLYNQENGTDDGSLTPSLAIDSYIQSAPFDIGEGDNFFFIKKVIPDVSFINSTATSPVVTMTLKMQDYPGADFSQTESDNVYQTATSPVEQFTEQVYVRLRGRQASFRIESNQVGTRWSLGSPRIEMQPDGRR